jgi:pyocin large subunit-like protein
VKEKKSWIYRIGLLIVCILALWCVVFPDNSTADNDTVETTYTQTQAAALTFRSDKLLQEHYEKHGIEMGFASAEEYQQAAAAVVANPDALHKLEADDGDDIYYLESTNEFVIVSTDGYIRTYYYPNDGIDYYNRK